ncbi:MAG: branched-chain amino acid ABC transporter permease [Anaerolineae bacterium]|nr:branched-chain amino acid ABC transporter permease [Anaerolineae bacterium]
MKRIPLQWILAAALFILALAAPVLLRGQQYWLFIAIQAFFYAMLASSWALLAGYAGQFSFGHIAFMAIASYASGILGRDLGWSPVPGIIAGTVLAGVVGLIIGYLCLRLRRTYLALFTIAFAEIFRLAVNAELDLTGGPLGLYVDYLLDTSSYIPYYYLMLGLLLGSLAFMYWLANSRFGLFFRSIREDEEAAAAMGVHVVRYKILAFVVTSMIAGLAGAVDHHFIGFIAPSELIIGRMSLIIAMAVIGGTESLLGAALGAIFVHFALEWLQEIPVPAALMPRLIEMTPTLERLGFGVGSNGIMTYAWRMVAFGLLLMLTLRFWRNGLIHPIIDRLTRQQAREESVAKRGQAVPVLSADGTSVAEGPVLSADGTSVAEGETEP